MIGNVQYMNKGTVYRIRNRKTNNYLTSATQVTTMPLQSDKISQLWLIDQIKPTIYEIVSMQSAQVLSRRQSITIQKGNWSSGQWWKLNRAQLTVNQNYFWLVSYEDQNFYLFASSASPKVSVKNFDYTLYVSNWQILQVDLDKDLKGCCVFKNQLTNLVIDVPEASNKDGVIIIQYTFNGRGNQRWVLEKVIDSFVIRNLCSNMILCPQNKSAKNATKIIQSQFSNKSQQKWIFERQGEEPNKFIIKNKADNTLFLGISSNKQSAHLQLTNQKQKGAWILQGSYSNL